MLLKRFLKIIMVVKFKWASNTENKEIKICLRDIMFIIQLKHKEITSDITFKDVAKNMNIKNILEPIKLDNKISKNWIKKSKSRLLMLYGNPHADYRNDPKKIMNINI